ncbi:MAG: hypothetical protein ACSLE5_15395 [Porticoccaceae bacterium]
MAPWLPAVKAILPYVTQIVTAAIPVFTRRNDKTGKEDVIPGQVAELQEAVTHNAESLKILATQLQQVVNGIDAGAIRIENELRTIKRLSVIAIALSSLALILSLGLWLR